MTKEDYIISAIKENSVNYNDGLNNIVFDGEKFLHKTVHENDWSPKSENEIKEILS